MMVKAADSLIEVVRGIEPGGLDAPSPCAQWSVRDTVNHVAYWSGDVSPYCAAKKAVPETLVEGTDYTGTEDWRDRFAERLNRAVDAWGAPGAWDGETSMGGSTPMPAAMVGGMLFGELVLHGHDLAVATAQKLRCDEDVAAATRDYVVGIAEMSREYNVFGEPKPVPAGASALEEALALSGRDPRP